MDMYLIFILGFCGALFLVMVGVVINSIIKERRIFSEKIEATIVELDVSNVGKVKTYRPIYRFELNGGTYDVPSNINKETTDPDRFIKGSKVTIKVNTDDPAQIKDSFEIKDIKNNILLILIGGSIVISVICAIGMLIYEFLK